MGTHTHTYITKCMLAENVKLLYLPRESILILDSLRSEYSGEERGL